FLIYFLFFFLMPPPPPNSTLFPYTTLFRSLPTFVVLSFRGGLRPLLNTWLEETFPMIHEWKRGEFTISTETARLDLKVIHEFLRSEEHTSEFQSQSNLVCRLLLEKKKTTKN